MVSIVAAMTMYAVCPKPELKTFTTYSRAFFDNDGTLLKITLARDNRYRIYQTLDQISPHLIQATILYEDQKYYHHSGIDFPALLRAFWTTYINHDRRVGGSTITMQVARLRWNIPSWTIQGKIQQIFRALQLSRHYSKEDILEIYLNLAPYGRNIEGVAAASLIYFNKSPHQLSLPEALTLAVIPQNPNKRNPTAKKGYSNLVKARANLFERWIEKNPDDSSKKKYLDLPLHIRSLEELPFSAPHFVNYIQQQLPQWRSGHIHTTLDSQQQKKLETIVANYVLAKQKNGISNSAALLINHRTMEIKAMIGSVDFHNPEIEGQVNGVTARRSPGSALKPFVYALAMDEGLVHPMTLMKDSPRKFGGFTPENYDKRFLGPVLAKDALIQSRNVPAVELQSKLKKKSLHSFLTDANIQGLRQENFYGLALALGGGEVSMMELVRLYGGLANNGEFKGIKFLKSQQVKPGEKLLSKEAAFLVLDILKDNPEPGSIDFQSSITSKNEVAWKTGTSWAFRDAWAVGISGPYVVAVWIGNFNGKGNDAFVGRTAAGPLFFSILKAVFPDEGWKVESLSALNQLNLKKVAVCSKTGGLLTKHCPQSTTSWFIPGVSPISISNIYRAIPVEKSSGLRACWHEPWKTKMQVYEFWPSDFQHIFYQAGISLKTPPGFSASCNLDQKSSAGQIPLITSPQNSIQYIVRHDDPTASQVPFIAITDPGVEDLYWFVNGKYEGISTQDQPLLWNATSGIFEVRVVDDAGRAASSIFHVLQL